MSCLQNAFRSAFAVGKNSLMFIVNACEEPVYKRQTVSAGSDSARASPLQELVEDTTEPRNGTSGATSHPYPSRPRRRATVAARNVDAKPYRRPSPELQSVKPAKPPISAKGKPKKKRAARCTNYDITSFAAGADIVSLPIKGTRTTPPVHVQVAYATKLCAPQECDATREEDAGMPA